MSLAPLQILLAGPCEPDILRAEEAEEEV